MKRVFAFVGFSSAITLFVLNYALFDYSKYIAIAALLLFLFSISLKNIRNNIVIPLTLASVLLSSVIFTASVNGTVKPISKLDGKVYNCVFHIVDTPTVNDDGKYFYKIKTSSINADGEIQNIKVYLYSENEISADYYESIDASLRFYTNDSQTKFLNNDYGEGIFIRAQLIDYKSTGIIHKNFNYYLIKIRENIKKEIESYYGTRTSGLALSVFTGDKALLSNDIVENFKVCGLSHLIAVSGLHISIVCLAVYYIMRFCGIGNLPRTIITLFLMICYCGIADYSKSVIRAAVMVSILLVSQLFKYKADTLNSMGLTTFLICLNPFAVCDISAVLTVSAVLGFIAIKPELDKLIVVNNKVLKYIYNSLTGSLCVILSTLPVMWMAFGKISFLGVVLNFVCIPLFQAALILIFIFYLFSSITVLSFLPLKISDFILNVIIDLTDFFSSKLYFLYADISSFAFGIAIAATFLLIGLILIFGLKLNSKIIISFFMAFVIVAAAFTINEKKNISHLYVYSSGAVVSYDGDCIVAIGVNDSSDFYNFKQLINSTDCNNIYCVDCDEYLPEINSACTDSALVFSIDNTLNSLCNKTSIILTPNEIDLILLDKNFKIYNNCVTIGDRTFVRNIKDKFSSDDNVTFYVTEKYNVQYTYY